MDSESLEQAVSGGRSFDRYLTRVPVVAGLLTLVAVAHTAILYLTLVGPLPAVTIAAGTLGLVVVGIVVLFRQSWRSGRPIAGQLTAAAAAVLALAFVTGAYRGPRSWSGDPAVRFVVETVPLQEVPTGLGLTVGFELAGGRAGVAQFLFPLVVGYVLLTGALWAHPGVARISAGLADSH